MVKEDLRNENIEDKQIQKLDERIKEFCVFYIFLTVYIVYIIMIIDN